MKATIVWTVLPRGIRPSGELELSLHLSPRLRPDGASAPLSAFADLQSAGDPGVNWASHAFSFGFEVDGPPTPLPPDGPPTESGPVDVTAVPELAIPPEPR